MLQWARRNGCSWEEEDLEDDWNDETSLDCCALAARGGHLEVLKWLRAQDCPWDEWTFASAAWDGHLEVLKWMREHGCPWEEDIEGSG